MYTITIGDQRFTGLHWNDLDGLSEGGSAQAATNPTAAEAMKRLGENLSECKAEMDDAHVSGDDDTYSLLAGDADWMWQQWEQIKNIVDAGIPGDLAGIAQSAQQVAEGSLEATWCLDSLDLFDHEVDPRAVNWELRLQEPEAEAGSEVVIFSEEWDMQSGQSPTRSGNGRVLVGYRVVRARLAEAGQVPDALSEFWFTPEEEGVAHRALLHAAHVTGAAPQ
ncbi:hypothetical protein GCM10027060_26390 [Nesterenkonia halophila]